MVPPFNQRSSKTFFCQANRKQLRSQGATAVLVQVKKKHPLVGRSFRASQLHLTDEFKGIDAGPVILIPPTKLGTVSIELDKQVNGSTELKNVVGVLKGSDPETGQASDYLHGSFGPHWRRQHHWRRNQQRG